MAEVTIILLAVSLILFFGFFAEFLFHKLGIPDVLFLLILGFVIGPHVFGYVFPRNLAGIAPVFTTFTLLFLLFDGAFNIHLASLIREFSRSFILTIFNFIISVAVITTVMFFTGHSLLISLLSGFLLGGVSSSFVIPILKEMKISEKVYSILTMESALTDVFCIVFSLSIIEIFRIGTVGIKATLSQLTGLFAIAGLVGLLGGIIWIILIIKVFEEHNYVMVVAYLILVYVVAQYLGGNGAIAALFFGLMLKNSKQLSSIIRGILTRKAREKKKALKGELGVSVTTPSEEFFYHQVSFLLKTFFFIYIGIVIDLSDWRALAVGGILSLVLMVTRMGSLLLTRGMIPHHRTLVNSMFARGLAAAAIAQLAVQAGIPNALFIANVTYVVITGTIVFSSLRIFILKWQLPRSEVAKAP